MPRSLIFNPGSASLKFDLVETQPEQRHAGEGKKLVSASIEEIDKNAQLLLFKGRELDHKESCPVQSIADGASFAVSWLRSNAAPDASDPNVDFVGVRVVHGGETLRSAREATHDVQKEVQRLEVLAPLHNKNSLSILASVTKALPKVPVFFAFDTAFHQTIPEVAWRYPIHRETADRYGIRKFGFHGLSHRYMLEQYAELSGRPVNDVSVVSLHLESGSSATAIRDGKSVDNTMGLTPLEGLMMGTRCGSIDPAILPFLVAEESITLDAVMELLNKRSGLLGIAGETLDTRILVRRNDAAAKLALRMFAYRVRLAVGSYLALLGSAQAVLFGGGIGEDSPWLRSEVAEGLRGFGLDFDNEANERATAGVAQLHREGSRLQAYAMAVDEGLQIAHECQQAFQGS